MQEDVGQITAEERTVASDGDEGASGAVTIAGGADKQPAAKAGADAKPQGKTGNDAPSEAEEKPKAKAGTIASGRDSEEEDADAESEKSSSKASLKDVQGWREEIAEYNAAGDKKAYQRELKRLERISDPRAIYGMYRELETKFTSGGIVKIPGKDAKPEEIEQFHKALGVPEKPEEYYKNLQLSNGAVVGEADKPFVDSFAQHVHKKGMTPEQFSAAMDWYYTQQESQAAQMDEQDDTHRTQSERELKDEFGASFKRRVNALPALFMQAPGGSDINNEKGVYARLMGGRTADGRLIGNDPDIIRWLDGLRTEINPTATLTEDGAGSAETLDQEIKKIEGIMRTDRRTYNRDYADRYKELLAIREKHQAKAR